jgi:pyruvate dehydrogenase E2 component (dihydrolipoyllysine-residue acetyltransferase)
MAMDVLMPQMGESVTEGTVTRWLKKVGETVGKDEPLFEISTDKVDAEIPSPAAGVLARILVVEGQTVGIHSVVAQIETAGGEKPAAPREETGKAAPRPSPQPVSQTRAAQPSGERKPQLAAIAAEDLHSSPLVRRLAAEHNVDLSQVTGTGLGGRITKEDLLAFVDRQKAGLAAAAKVPAAPAVIAPAPSPGAPGRDETVPMSAMRKKIAEHMVLSRRTSAHVTTVFAVDLTPLVGIYHREKERFEQQENTRLGYTPFFIRALLDGLKKFPILNSSVSGDNIVYKKDVHMGVAVALDWGLIVPVIHNASGKSFKELTSAVNDLADRARRKKLSVDEVQGGTFTITNPGALGSLFATPIINQPQVGIVGVGSINKMPVVINDAIAIRSIVHLSLSYDHRIIDGAVADQFMAAVKSYLENWEEPLM